MMNTLSKSMSAWVMVSRLRTFPIPTIQVITGVGLAYALTGELNLMTALYTCLAAIFITCGTNLINDVYDIQNGGDGLKRNGQMKAIRLGLLSKRQVFIGGMVSFLLAIACAIPLAYHVGPNILYIVIFSTFLGFAYTGGPFPISYLGLSELFIFLFYGIVCVAATYYIQTLSLDIRAFICAAQMGLLAILPNALNNFRDMFEDAEINKRTLAVRFGKSFARWEIAVLTALPFVINLVWLYYGYYMVTILPMMLLPLAFLFVRSVWKKDPSPVFNKYFGLSVLLHFLFGILFLLGFVTEQWLSYQLPA